MQNEKPVIGDFSSTLGWRVRARIFVRNLNPRVKLAGVAVLGLCVLGIVIVILLLLHGDKHSTKTPGAKKLATHSTAFPSQSQSADTTQPSSTSPSSNTTAPTTNPPSPSAPGSSSTKSTGSTPASGSSGTTTNTGGGSSGTGGTSGGTTGGGGTQSLQPDGAPGNWTLKFDDEFDGTSVNTTNWVKGRRSGLGPYNASELETFSPNNVTVSNGSMLLTANHTSSDGGTHPWTSGAAEMKTSAPNGGNYTYGYFEARIKVPNTVGWTAFWLTSASGWPPEIDIFEFHFCTKPLFNTHGTTNGSNSNVSGWGCSGTTYGSGDFTQYHTYGLLWKSNKMSIYFDGVLQNIAALSGTPNNGIPSTPMYPIFDYAIANGSDPGNGTQMAIDYLRIWQ